MRIIAYRTASKDGQVLLEESTGDSVLSNDVVELFTFLVNQFEEEGECIKVCWNLDVTVSLFLRLLGEVKCSQLKDTKRCHVAPFDVFYIPGKMFSIVHIPTRTKSNLYWIEQYFVEIEEPTDVITIKMLGEEFGRELKKMGLEPTKFTSAVAMYDECVMRTLDLPKLKDIPLEAGDFSYRASGRLWIESFILGMHDKIYDYDLVSAHPSIAKELIDTRSCYWKKSKDYQDKSIYGYVKAKMTIHSWVMVHPIIQETEEGCVSPIGTWEGYFTKGELDFVNKWQIGEFEILDGWWCIPAKGKELTKPLHVPMSKLLEYKQNGGLQRLIAKRASNGIYGRFGEDRGEEFGPNFFPPWFAEISTQTKLQVGEFLYQHKIGPRNNKGFKHLLHIGVDSVMLDCPIEEIK